MKIKWNPLKWVKKVYRSWKYKKNEKIIANSTNSEKIEMGLNKTKKDANLLKHKIKATKEILSAMEKELKSVEANRKELFRLKKVDPNG